MIRSHIKILNDYFSLDVRSLASFRIGIALIILCDLVIRLGSLEAMYSDTGMFPRHEIASLSNSWNWSFHYLCGETGCLTFLFGLAGVAAIMLLIGYQAKLAALVSWILMLSLHHRVPMILNGGDILLRMLLFWSIFLPLDACWAVSARKHKSQSAFTAASTISSPASAAIMLQMAIMYFFSAILKSNADWFSGDAMEGTLNHDLYATSIGAGILSQTFILRLATWATLGLEYLAPLILVFLPRLWKLKMGVILTLWGFHLIVVILMKVGLFSAVSMVGLLLFVPSEFWVTCFHRFAGPSAHISESGLPHHSINHPFVIQLFVWVGLVLVLITNIVSLFPDSKTNLTRFVQHNYFLTGLGFSQRWGMFEKIPTQDGWFVAAATLANGEKVDLLRLGNTLSWERPRVPAQLFPDHRWRK